MSTLCEEPDGKMQRRGWVILVAAALSWFILGGTVVFLVKAAKRFL